MFLEELDSTPEHILPVNHPSCSIIKRKTFSMSMGILIAYARHVQKQHSKFYFENFRLQHKLHFQQKALFEVWNARWHAYLASAGRTFWIFCSWIKHWLQHSSLCLNLKSSKAITPNMFDSSTPTQETKRKMHYCKQMKPLFCLKIDANSTRCRDCWAYHWAKDCNKLQ